MENENLMLVMPSMKHRRAAVEYVSEFLTANEDIDGVGYGTGADAGGADMHGSEFTADSGSFSDILADYDAYGEWLYWLYGKGEEPSANGIGSSFTYFFMTDTEEILIGTVNIRYGNELAERYGNLGFAVRPSMRGKGCGTAMVAAAVSMCGFAGMDRLTAVCGKNNTVSAKVLEKCGFVRVDKTAGEGVGGKVPDNTDKENSGSGENRNEVRKNTGGMPECPEGRGAEIWFERTTDND